LAENQVATMIMEVKKSEGPATIFVRSFNFTPIGGVSFSVDSFVVKESAVLQMNYCAKKPAHRKSANRWWQV